MIVKKLLTLRKGFPLLITVAFYSLLVPSLTAQEAKLEDLTNAFDAYNDLVREVAYCHLNKSTYINTGDWITHFTYAVFDGTTTSLKHA